MNYDLTTSVTFDSFTPASTKPNPDTDLTITGTNFGTDSSIYAVNLKDANDSKIPLTITSITDTEIVCDLPVLQLGDYEVELLSKSEGYLPFTGSENKLTSYMKVTVVSESTGSIYGK